MNLSLIQGVATPVTLDGQWLYIEAAKGKIEVYRESTGERVSLKQSAVFTADQGALGRIHLTASETGQVSIESGRGQFVPPVEGQSVVIEAQPAVEIAAGQKVTVEALPAVKIAPNQNVTIYALPAVTIAGGQYVSINQLPAVEIAAGQSLAVNSIPAMEIAAGQSLAINTLPKVQIEAGQKVGLDSAITVAAGQKVGLDAPIEVAAGQQIAVTAPIALPVQSVLNAGVNSGGGEVPQTIQANASRDKVTIKASATNTASVMIGAYPLGGGETLTLETTAQIDLTGAAGDFVYFIEVTQ